MKNKTKSIMLVHEVSPYPFYFIPEFLTYQYPSFVGAKHINFPLTQEWSNRTLRGAGNMESTNKMAMFISNKILSDYKWTSLSIKNYYSEMSKLYDYLKNVSKYQLQTASNQQLISIVLKYRELFINMYLWGWLPNAAEGLDNHFSALLKQRVKKYVKSDTRVNKILSAITTSTKPMLREQEQLRFLQLCKVITSVASIRQYFLDNNIETILLNLKLKYPTLFKKIESHRKKFAWVYFKYEGPEWDTYYLVGLIKEALQNNTSAKSSQLTESKIALKNAQTNLKGKYRFDPKDLHLFKIARDFMDLKEHQKDRLFMCYHIYDKVCKEIARRLYLSPKQMRHMLHSEIIEALKTNQADPNMLNERIKYCVMVLRNNKPLRILTGKNAINIAKREFPKLHKVSVFKGQCACPGKVIAEVSLVQETKDITKMKKGNVLVTTRTNPNLLPAIRIASAIVADIGGVGSHAAIVSRELKIPCVVGVYNASMVLIDGDLIEVDATNGLVRKINKSDTNNSQ